MSMISERGMATNELQPLCELFKQAREGTLQPEFDQWGISDEEGWSVAHVAAYYDNLPPEFDQWDLVDDDGWSVAHVAAPVGNLLPEFDQWDLADDDGRTVRELYEEWKWKESLK